MPKYILRNGLPLPPEEAYFCPCCGERAGNMEWLNSAYRIPSREYKVTLSTLSQMQVDSHREPVPTFECFCCKCIWQWEETPKNCEDKN